MVLAAHRAAAAQRERSGLWPSDFEAPLLALQKRIEELAAFPGDPVKEQEARRLRQELEQKRRSVYAELTPWQKTQVARHPEPSVHARLRRRALHRLHRAARRPALRRRSGARHGLRALQGPRRWPWSATRRAATPSRRSTGTSGCRSRRATARRCASCSWRRSSAGRSSPSWTRPGAYPGPRRRGARAGGGDRLQPARDGAPAHADHRERDGRGRQRRRAGRSPSATA